MRLRRWPEPLHLRHTGEEKRGQASSFIHATRPALTRKKDACPLFPPFFLCVGLSSPIETVQARGYGFVSGGRTGGDAREWNINNGTSGDLGAFDIQINPLK